MSINYSFIIPHRNSPELLKRCVCSIPQRDDVQIIVIDDNSDVNLKPDLNRQGVTIKLLTKEEAKGAGHARNIGIEMAQGKWLLFADADDYYSEKLLDTLDKYKEHYTDVVYFNYYRIFKNGRKLQNNVVANYHSNHNQLDIIKYKTKAPWNKMVRRQFITDYNMQFEEVINGNDMFFTFQVGYWARRVEVDKEPIYIYDTSADGMTNKKRNSAEYFLCRLNHWYQTNEFYDFIKHGEWKSFIPSRFVAVLVKKGFQQFCLCVKVYISNITEIRKNRYRFVNQIKRFSICKP